MRDLLNEGVGSAGVVNDLFELLVELDVHMLILIFNKILGF